MKKSLFFCLAIVSLLFSACSGSETSAEYNYNIPILNYVTSVDGSGEPVISGSYYNYKMDMVSSTMEVSAQIGTGTNSTVKFTTSSLPFKPLYFNLSGAIYEIIQSESFLAGKTDDGDPINQFNCELTSIVNTPPIIAGLPELKLPTTKYTFMQYYIGTKYYVRTLWNDLTFDGSTSTTSPMGSYATDDVQYRVVINVKENKATVILYDCKFNESMPSISNIVLKDLPITFSNYGYSIKGTNVTPYIYEGGEGTPNNKYIFNSFEFNSNGDFSKANCDYEVMGGALKGNFSGSCLKTAKELQEDKE